MMAYPSLTRLLGIFYVPANQSTVALDWRVFKDNTHQGKPAEVYTAPESDHTEFSANTNDLITRKL